MVRWFVGFVLVGCGPAAPQSAPAPAHEPAPAPAAAPAAVPSPAAAESALGTRLVSALGDPNGAAAFAALTASSVELTVVSECGEPPFPTPDHTTVAEADKAAWHAKHATSWSQGQIRTDEAATACADGCCEVRNVGHGAHWLERYCVEGGVVTSVRIQDGC